MFGFACLNEKMAPGYCLDRGHRPDLNSNRILKYGHLFSPLSKYQTEKTVARENVSGVRGCIFWSDIFFPAPLTKLRQKQLVISLCRRPLLYQRDGGKSVLSKRHSPGFWVANMILEQCLLSCHICEKPSFLGKLHPPPPSICTNS